MLGSTLKIGDGCRYVLAVGLAAALVSAHGCSSQSRLPKTHPVSGTVLLDGKPMADGEIYFRNIETGSLNILPIKAGRFVGRAEAGSLRAEINAFHDVITPENKAMYGDLATPSRVNTIPSRYNIDSDFVAEVHSDGSNDFAYEVTSK